MWTGRAIGAAGVLALVAAGAGSAFGQLQVQQGNALDANPLVGSGGSNTPVQGYVPINGNDIVTGNVAGLKYFHAPVGTFSPYTFQGNLGTATLSNFARQSAGGIPTTPTGGLNSVYYLPSSTVSTAQGSLYFAPATGGFDSRLVPTSSLAPTGGVNGGGSVPVVAGLQLRQFDVGNSSNPLAASTSNGQITSPLFGLRPTETPTGVQPPTGQPVLPNQGERPGERSGERGTSSPSPTDLNNTGGREGTGTIGGRDNGAIGGATGGDRTSGRVDTRVRNGGQEGGTAEERTMRVTGAYATLLEQLQRARGGKSTNATNLDIERNVSARSGDVIPNSGRTGNGTEGGRGTAVARNGPGGTSPLLAGGAGNGAGGVGTGEFQSTDPTRPNYRPLLTERRPVGAAALANTPKETLQEGRQVGELKSLAAPAGAGATAPAFEELMKRGEQRLKDGKYLESADVYQQAISAQPNNALAVLGRGHAELAAGMYESAAADLQFVFTKKPELVSVKYALGDYLPLDRQVFLMNDLLKLSQGKDTGNMASFLLCYLTYQTGRGAELKAELDRWAARPWKDEWQTVADKAWR